MPDILCIGGPKDGEWVEDDGKYTRHFICNNLLPALEAEKPPSGVMMTTEVYIRQRLRGEGREWFYLVHESLTVDEAINRLFMGYMFQT